MIDTTSNNVTNGERRPLPNRRGSSQLAFIRRALLRGGRGVAASPLGRALDIIAAEDGAA